MQRAADSAQHHARPQLLPSRFVVLIDEIRRFQEARVSVARSLAVGNNTLLPTGKTLEGGVQESESESEAEPV